jgi:hypothetical protein
MSQSKHDLNLAEVKAVLGRLQQISRRSHGAGDQAGRGGTPDLPGAPAPAESRSSDPALRITSLIALVMNGPRHARAVALIVLLLTLFAGLALLIGIGERPGPVKEPPLVRAPPSVNEPAPLAGPGNPAPAGVLAQEAQKSPAAAALQTASDLMSSGQVRAARDVLLRLAPGESADVAWALARSYDPNYLVTIGAADASPNVPEATRWYRTWFDTAVKQGLIADSVSLDRIIRSMNELTNR